MGVDQDSLEAIVKARALAAKNYMEVDAVLAAAQDRAQARPEPVPEVQQADDVTAWCTLIQLPSKEDPGKYYVGAVHDGRLVAIQKCNGLWHTNTRGYCVDIGPIAVSSFRILKARK